MPIHIEVDKDTHMTKVFKNGIQLEHLHFFEMTVGMDKIVIKYHFGTEGANLTLPFSEVTGRLESSNYVVELGPTPRVLHKIDSSDQYGQAPMQEEFMGRIEEAKFVVTKQEPVTPTLDLKITFR